MSEYKTFTSESVSEGHPDKLADQISDAILDAFLKDDPDSRVACETLVKTDLVVIAGEISSNAKPDLETVVRSVINEVGYDNDEVGFNGSKVEIVNAIGMQSNDIAQGVNEGTGTDTDVCGAAPGRLASSPEQLRDHSYSQALCSTRNICTPIWPH